MATLSPMLPRWTWEQVETALRQVPHSPSAEAFLERQLEALREEGARMNSSDLLQEILMIGAIIRSPLGEDDTGHHPPPSLRN